MTCYYGCVGRNNIIWILFSNCPIIEELCERVVFLALALTILVETNKEIRRKSLLISSNEMLGGIRAASKLRPVVSTLHYTPVRCFGISDSIMNFASRTVENKQGNSDS